jgi:hypothetical protein
MRVFLKTGKTLRKPGGGSISWPAESFCVVDDALGQEWYDAGDAELATDSNEVIERPPEPEPEPEDAPTDPLIDIPGPTPFETGEDDG